MGLRDSKKNMTIIVGNSLIKRFVLRFCFSLLLSYLLFYLILGPTHFWREEGSGLYKLYFFISNSLASFGIFAPELMAAILCGMGILFFINLILIPILGLSLADYLSGIRLKDDGTENRVSLILKSYVSYYLDGLCLFLCPIGERITGLPLKIKKKRKPIFLGLIGLLIICIIAPFITLASFSENIRLKTSVVETMELEREGNFANYIDYESERFNLSAFSSLDNNRYILIPSYDILSYSRKSSYIAKMIFYDLLGKTAGELKAEKTFNMRELLQVFARYNPLFKVYYPTLADFEQSGKISSLDEFKTESEAFYFEVLQTGPLKLLVTLFKWGPFTRNHLQAREYILSYSGSNLFTEGEFVKMGDGHFFRMRSVYQAERLHLKDVFIPMLHEKMSVPSMSFEAGEQGINSRDQLLKAFFSTSKWSPDIKTDIENLSKDHIQPFHILDHFLKNDLSETARSHLDEYTTRHFFNLARESLKREDDYFKDIVLQSLRRYLVIVRNREQTEVTLKIYHYFESLEKALSNKNLSYFNL